MSIYGNILNPDKTFMLRNGVKSEKLHVKLTHNPSSVSPNETIKVTLPKLQRNDVLIPESLKLTFDFGTTENDFVNNLASSLITKYAVKVGGHTIIDVNNYDVLMVYKDLWLSKADREDMYAAGIQVENVRKLRHNVSGKTEDDLGEIALSNAHKTRYEIPLQFPMLSQAFSPYNFMDDIVFELTFKPSNKVLASGEYKITAVALEFDKINHTDLTETLDKKMSEMAIPFSTVHHYRSTEVSKSATSLNIDISHSLRSLRGILVLFKNKETFAIANNEKYANPKITKMLVDLDGVSNQLYSAGAESMHVWRDCKNYFLASKDSDMTQKDFYKDKCALFIDFRTIHEDMLHGTGREIKQNVNIKLTKEATTEDLEAHVFLIYDINMGILNNRFSVINS